MRDDAMYMDIVEDNDDNLYKLISEKEKDTQTRSKICWYFVLHYRRATICTSAALHFGKQRTNFGDI